MKKRIKNYQGFLYILPSLFFITVFSFLPILITIFLSFTKYNIIQPAQWIGIKNYFRMFHDPFVQAAVGNTIVYTIIVVPVQTLFSLFLANSIAKHVTKRFGNAVKSILFVPVISSMIVVGAIWKFMLGTEGGLVNIILSFIGIGNINWLGSTTWSLLSICLVSIWRNVGYFLVIFYAGIMDIPKELYEAARVDGASNWEQLVNITIPILRPVVYLVITLGTIWSFQVFDLVYTMTGGGPGTSTVTLVLTIYDTAFKEFEMGYASAVAFLLFGIIMIFSIVQRNLLRERG